MDAPMQQPDCPRCALLEQELAAARLLIERLQEQVRTLREEVAELKNAIANKDESGTKRVAEEFGDLLFVMANLARHLKIDPETALCDANAKFTRRFKSIEAALAKDGRRPEDATLEEMDQLWDEAKAAEKD